MKDFWIIFIHQSVFQGMFITKNIILKKKTGKQVRGKNKELTVSIALFSAFIASSFILSAINHPIGKIQIIESFYARAVGLIFLLLNLLISSASLYDLKESWRVGVIESQKTELITSGIYSLTRNPYFLSYLLFFAGYIFILQNLFLLIFAILGFLSIHKMILKEEKYLRSMHGDQYLVYKKKVPRYFFF